VHHRWKALYSTLSSVQSTQPPLEPLVPSLIPLPTSEHLIKSSQSSPPCLPAAWKALVVGVEFRDLTEGAEKTPPLKCRKHGRDLVEEEDEEEEKDLEKAVSGGVSGPHLRRPRYELHHLL